MSKLHSYLALGDSYTIGEQLPLIHSFPYQLVQSLRNKEAIYSAPEIIAQTGWNTQDLLDALEGYRLLPEYNLISVLIGVNNQYRGLSTEEYSYQLEQILKKTLRLTRSGEQVIVISIPDYGRTPFSSGKDIVKISAEIDQFNLINKALSVQFKTRYADISELCRRLSATPGGLTADGLHPSRQQYQEWVQIIEQQLSDV